METPIENTSPKENFLHPLENKTNKNNKPMAFVILGAVVIIVAGITTGNLLVSKRPVQLDFGGKPKVIRSEKVVGSTDTKSFRDSATGVLEKGGMDGEGTHHLTREGGPSQTAYLTSSVIDLDNYVGKKVKVFGETFTAQKAGWLMDAGKIEILE